MGRRRRWNYKACILCVMVRVHDFKCSCVRTVQCAAEHVELTAFNSECQYFDNAEKEFAVV